ncbi:hypothetical protein [Mechercharimyces sp. CAU 1602]|uniref:hypothetical protein n=1 Tax=Mechercharimyces sp. CAU 1602 TaxID=2973933 RepID=UPI002162C758|nr:hypothetical protein [Mechercharimyces sp. CAU 1602]MCS1350140.1 hypothetical protein [Mechercharimyces sp. CAU 1602]
MHDVILLCGKVTYPLTLDPSVWIFDERKRPLSDWIPDEKGEGMALQPFLAHAEPSPDCSQVVCHRESGEPITVTLDEMYGAVLCFTRDGKPIRPHGPAILYLMSGTYAAQPIDAVTKMQFI